MNKLFAFIFCCLILLSCRNELTVIQEFDAIAQKVSLKEDYPEEFFYWELDNSESLWKHNLHNVPALMAYADTLKQTLGEKLFEEAIQKEADENLDIQLVEGEENGDRINAILVHSGHIGKIKKINYLESQILNYQLERFPLFSHPTEFHGFIIQNDSLNKIRVYFGASDTEWPPRPKILVDEVQKELNDGWKMIRHLHNHYCKADENYIGILAPSLADAQYFKMLKDRFQLDKATITNGFHTVEIDSSDFEKFESH